MAERRKLTRRDWVWLAVGAVAMSAVATGIRRCHREQREKRRAWDRRQAADPGRDEANRAIRDWLESQRKDGETEE